jgi:hypothetical protein
MLTLLGSRKTCCDGLTRREALQAGGLSLLGSFFGAPNRLDAAARPQRVGKAKNVIVLYLFGGAATQDMVDLKPDAPDGIRSLFKPIATNVTGIQVCEHLPQLARWMHKTAIIRSVNHKAGCHNPMPCFTGYGEPVPITAGTRTEGLPPSMGSVCTYLAQHDSGQERRSELPTYVHMPTWNSWGTSFRYPGPDGNFLGRRYDPMYTECTPHIDNPPEKGDYFPQLLRGVPRLPNATPPEGITLDQMNQRRQLIEQFDDQLRETAARGSFERAQQQAFTLLHSRKIKAAFDLEGVPAKLRERYGNGLFGNCSLIARQLVEQGVQFINVVWESFGIRMKINSAGWDTHARNFEVLKEYNLPYFDLAYSALLEDLEARGLLDQTLVVVMSEMGRAPKIGDPRDKGQAPGRDHWTFCYSVLLAGAGIRGGAVHGASDAHAAYVKDSPVSPADICATIYHCLGIDPETEIRDSSGRPVPIAQGGRPVRDILA